MKVSVLMTTYNHERFIAKAVNSVLMQKVSFDYEIVIGEDFSIDNTRNIVVDFRDRYPDKICVLVREKNLGGRKNLINTLKACKGEYIALLEGDDYWTSPHKLQKQVDFLDCHPECVICFHNVMVIYDDNPGVSHPFYVQNPDGPFMQRKPKSISSLEDLVKGNFIQTPAVMHRAALFEEFPKWFYRAPVGDWPLHILNAQYGNIAYIDELMGTYRVHSNGFWSSRKLTEKLRGEIETYRLINAFLRFRYNNILKSRISLDYYRVAEAYRNEGDDRGACINLFKCMITSPFNQPVPLRFLLLRMAAWITPGPARRTIRTLLRLSRNEDRT